MNDYEVTELESGEIGPRVVQILTGARDVKQTDKRRRECLEQNIFLEEIKFKIENELDARREPRF